MYIINAFVVDPFTQEVSFITSIRFPVPLSAFACLMHDQSPKPIVEEVDEL